MKNKAVLFDLDGVLVDAVELHFHALNKALGEYGYTITRQEHETTYNGLPTRVKLQLLWRDKGLPESLIEPIKKRKQELTLECIEELPYDPQKPALVSALRRAGLKLAVCSNAKHQSVLAMLHRAGLSGMFDVVLGNEDVERPKPAPDIYLLAADLLGVPIGECKIVEDSAVGLEAAALARPLEIVRVAGPAEVDLRLLPQLLR